ncbi:MAG TPA: iron-sulfur cluster assembly scaffold protein [Candidatus Aminicenantes bacterium]|nr:iron-sulfur cluster assembly scaffold protein [Candidatus Aminicenantes bacterium]
MSDEDRDGTPEEEARELREEMERQVLEIYGPTVLDHWKHPRNLGLVEGADGYARLQGPCGDTMEMTVRMDGDVVADCGFRTDGCGTTIVCGSAATWLAKGRSFVDALGAVGARGILELLGGLPKSDVHCAELAAETLRLALADHLAHRGSPWKRKYRKMG